MVTVKLFAAAKSLAGADEVRVPLGHPARIAELREALCKEFPQLSVIVGKSAFAVDNCYVSNEHVLKEGCEIACIPPVSGG